MGDRKSAGFEGVSGAARGFVLPLEGLGLLLRERALRRMAVLPLLISLVALAAAGAGVVSQAPELHAWTTGILTGLEPGAWYTWLWVGPVNAAFWLLGKLLFLVLVAFALVAALVVASVVASPFHDELSRRVERVVTGAVRDEGPEGVLGVVRDSGRVVREELRRLLFFAAVWAGILAFGVLVPGGQLVAPLLGTLFTLLFLPLDYAAYTLDRRRLSFAAKRRWVRGHLGASLGFGASAFLLTALPVVNVLAMPVLVVAGTLLALRNPDASRP